MKTTAVEALSPHALILRVRKSAYELDITGYQHKYSGHSIFIKDAKPSQKHKPWLNYLQSFESPRRVIIAPVSSSIKELHAVTAWSFLLLRNVSYEFPHL